MEAKSLQGLPAAPGNSPAPGELKSGEGAKPRIVMNYDDLNCEEVEQ
jgi:hypothetical protein